MEPDAAKQAAANVAAVHSVNGFSACDGDSGGPGTWWTWWCAILPLQPSKVGPKNLARHDDTLPLRVLFSEAKRALRRVFQFVFPTERAEEVLSLAEKEGWLLMQRISLAWSDMHEPIRDLWTWTKETHPALQANSELRLMQDPGTGTWSSWLKLRLSKFLMKEPGI